MVNHAYYATLEATRRHHRPWLKLSLNRCPLTLKPIGRVGGRHHSYNMHHSHYRKGRHGLYASRYLIDIIPLSEEAHMGFIHGVLSGGRSAGKQGNFPNPAQRLTHAYCRLVLLIFLVIRFWRPIAIALLLAALYATF